MMIDQVDYSPARRQPAAIRWLLAAALCCGGWWSSQPRLLAQAVGLPAPRLLTTTPLGGKAGSEVEVTITGENIDDADELTFSDRRITASRKRNAAGQPEPNKYVVTIAADYPLGVHEARVMTRLGISSSRAFSVGTLDEVTPAKTGTTLATA